MQQAGSVVAGSHRRPSSYPDLSTCTGQAVAPSGRARRDRSSLPPKPAARRRRVRLVAALAVPATLVGCGSAKPNDATATGSAARSGTKLWPCPLVPTTALRRAGLAVLASSPPGGKTRPTFVECGFFNPATTVAAVLMTGQGAPSGSGVELPGVRQAYMTVYDIPIDAAAVMLSVPTGGGTLGDYWAVTVSCRTGCDTAAATTLAEALATAIAPRAPQLFRPQLSGTRYWAPGPGRAVVSGGPSR